MDTTEQTSDMAQAEAEKSQVSDGTFIRNFTGCTVSFISLVSYISFVAIIAYKLYNSEYRGHTAP